jgi:Rrf2 family protein
MTLSRTVVYAIQATLELATADPGRPVSSSKLAERQNLPERFLLQVLRTLVREGVLRSSRGVDGGYSLNAEPESLTLLDIIKPFSFRLTLTGREQQELSQINDALAGTLEHAANAARRELQKKTIADLIASRRGKAN